MRTQNAGMSNMSKMPGGSTMGPNGLIHNYN